MLDLRSLPDVEVLDLLEEARGDDRAVLTRTLGVTSGDEGVPYLTALLAADGKGSAHERAAATEALARRTSGAVVSEADLARLALEAEWVVAKLRRRRDRDG